MENNEMRCFIYSLRDGNKIKTFNITKQMDAQSEYRELLERKEDVGYFEGSVFPLDIYGFKFDSAKKTFEPKTAQELVRDGYRTLKKYEKIVLNSIIIKEPYEMYTEGLILNKPYELVFKIDKNNILKRKNIVELLKINFSEKEIKDGILEKIITLFDYKYSQLKNKYPEFEVYNFNYKVTQAYLWQGLSQPAKIRILNSESRISGFNIILTEFYDQLSDSEKNNNIIILDKMNMITDLIIEKEKIYKKNYSYLLQTRNHFTGKLREMKLTENSINGFLNEFNGFYGEDILKIEDLFLTERYYSSIPMPDVNFYN